MHTSDDGHRQNEQAPTQDDHGAAPILVTGAHRSGTTWVGQVLARAPDVAYIHEPFNRSHDAPPADIPLTRWFQYVTDEVADEFYGGMSRLLSFRYPLAQNILGVRRVRAAARIARDQFLFMMNRAGSRRPLVKDPIALFSAEWLYRTFEMDVVVMIRHPAAFCSSLKRKKWRFDFNEFASQPALVKRYLAPYESRIRAYASGRKSIVEQATLLWNCIHSAIDQLRTRYPEWQFVRHEDLSRAPVSGFEAIYHSLGIPFTDRERSYVFYSSGVHNPSEPQPGSEFIRDSRANILNWKKRLTAREIAYIRMETEAVAARFYSDDAW